MHLKLKITGIFTFQKECFITGQKNIVEPLHKGHLKGTEESGHCGEVAVMRR